MKALAPALAALLALGAAPSQEKFKLELRAKPGEKYTRTITESSEFKAKFSLGDLVQDQESREKEVRKHHDEVLEAEAGEPTKLRRRFVEWWHEKKEGRDAEAAKESRTLEGRTIVLRKSGDKTEVEGADDAPRAELRKNRLRADPLLNTLPKEAVAPGHEWKLDEKLILEELAEDAEDGQIELTKASGTARFEKVEDFKGSRCAAIAVTIEADGSLKAAEAIKAKFRMKGTLHLALETGRVLSLRFEGTGDLSGEAVQNDVKVKIDGKFTFRSEGENRYE